MPKAREVKSRIANISDIKQITKAMNAIAMAKVTSLKKKISNARPYYNSLTEKKRTLLRSSEEVKHPLLERNGSDVIGCLSLNSDRGLAGNYTIDINRSTRDFINSKDQTVTLFTGGDKGERYFRSWGQMEKSWVDFYTNPEFRHAEEIGSEMAARFSRGEMSELWVIYMKFYSDLKQELTIEKILPMAVEPKEGEEDIPSASASDEYLYEPEEEEILDRFLISAFYEKIYWILLHTKTSEHAIRRRAMRDATDNASELIDELTIAYNKARQQQITREIADIIGGAEALRGK
ncbi:MAG: ATP synthase F1 subunit gamma [Candidatus Acetothermia bacterium]